MRLVLRRVQRLGQALDLAAIDFADVGVDVGDIDADSDDAATLFRFDAATLFRDDAATLGGGLVSWF